MKIVTYTKPNLTLTKMNKQQAGEHTQGEWIITQPTASRKEFPLNIQQGVQVLAIVGHIDAYANAKLIAAAPDMLKALEQVFKYFEDVVIDEEQHELIFKIKVAINKAKGL